ncbi:RNA-dependent RNA polymerase [Mycena venus]|uniref:RNA-dependent RNA polymerase n=1 Tax=Mycena venus TaxID=2733690 RepID=A0A8H6Y564_9AGAR|nr:RNA-dependent RNA polymerase [Mycena venus]
MYNKATFGKTRVPFARLQVDLSDRPKIELKEYYGHESRATRLVGDSRRFMTVSFTKAPGERIKAWLQQITQTGEGITIDGNKYVFLGFTESSLKAGHLLFFREGEDFTVETLKQSFGDLKAVYDDYGYGKYAARLGLSFSSTIGTQEIDPTDKIELPDLKASDGSLTSDGCGLIRASYCSEISSFLEVPSDTAVFQIRLGGIKGVLMRCPDDLFEQICGCSNKKIAYRPSMLKYEGGPQVLEVQNVSRPPKSGRLNKQFIVLLLTRGIPLTVFEELLQMRLDEIDKITTDREKALECVDGEVDAEGMGFYQALYEMLLAGHDMNEPYLATLLRRFQNTARDSLRSKLNIPVKGSGYVFGVVDHCGVLKEGEVYINWKGGPQVGTVAVMRTPAYDSDGIRVLEAVNKPELKHLTNCIVFASSGAHSEPDRMGGGDLDGDQYYVVFNPLLIPSSREPAPPRVKLQAAVSRTLSIGGQTQVISSPRRRNTDMLTDAIDTFIEMRCNFLVGEIFNQWMAIVGATPQLADLKECRELVPLIEDALDAVKTGSGLRRIKDDFRRVKRRIQQIHFADEWKNPLEILADGVPERIPEEMQFTPDPDLILRSSTSEEDWLRLVQDAKATMKEYNQDLQSAIDADKEIKSFGLEDEKRADIFKAETIAEHFPAVDNLLFDIPKYLLKASVWYSVGYENKKQSFAWLGARWLNYIKAMRTGHVPLAVGARSTPLVPAFPRVIARPVMTATEPVSPPRSSRVPSPTTPHSSARVASTSAPSPTSTPQAPRQILREGSSSTAANSEPGSNSPLRSVTPLTIATVQVHSAVVTPRPLRSVVSSSPSSPTGSRQIHLCAYVLRTPNGTSVCACGLLPPLRNWNVSESGSSIV